MAEGGGVAGSFSGGSGRLRNDFRRGGRVGWGCLLIGVLAWIGESSGVAEPSVAPSEPYTAAVRGLETWIAAEVEAKGLPALSIALVDDQRIVWSRGFGFADRERRIPADADTVYRVGSVSKLFT